VIYWLVYRCGGSIGVESSKEANAPISLIISQPLNLEGAPNTRAGTI